MLLHTKEAVVTFAQNPVVIEADEAGMARQFAAAATARQDIDLFYRLSADGGMIYHYPSTPNILVGQDFSDHPDFQAARFTQEHLFSNGQLSFASGQPVITSLMPTFADDDYIYQGVAAGARGYLLKDAPPDQLIEAIRATHRGESLLDPEVAARILDQFSSMIEQAPEPPSSDRPADRPPPPPTYYELSEGQKWLELPKLTPREMEVLRLMSQGVRNKEIAQNLVIAERTVKIHVGNILGKLEVTNRTEAVAVAIKMGLL